MVNRDQADEAFYLIREVEDFGPFIELAPKIPQYVLDSIRQAHARATGGCAAHSEGLLCCIDVLTGDLARYAPERVEEARRTLHHYNAGKGT